MFGNHRSHTANYRNGPPGAGPVGRVNLKIAKVLGSTVPASLIATADQVIE
jgi:hypothetical protein